MIKDKNFQINFLLVLMLSSTLLGTAIFNAISSLFTLRVLFDLYKNKDFEYLKQKWFILLNIFFLILLVSTFLSEYKSLIVVKNLPLFRFFLLALCIQYCLQKQKNIRLFLVTITGITLFLTFDALIQYFFGTNLFGNNLSQENIARVRITSIFGDEEIVGSFLIKFIFFGCIGSYLLFNEKKIFSYLYFIIVSITILISQERMAFILLLFSIFIIFQYFLFSKKFKEIITIFLALTILLIISFGLDESLKARYLSIFTNSSGITKVQYDSSNKPINIIDSISEIKNTEISFKDSMWGAHYLTAAQIFKHNFLLGSGPRSFRYECGKKKYENLDIHYIKKRCSSHPHNYYLEILSETGLFGFGYILILLIVFYYKQLKIYNKRKDIRHLFGLLAIFINLWPIASTGSIYGSFNGLIIWITIGYVLSFSGENLKVS